MFQSNRLIILVKWCYCILIRALYQNGQANVRQNASIPPDNFKKLIKFGDSKRCTSIFQISPVFNDGFQSWQPPYPPFPSTYFQCHQSWWSLSYASFFRVFDFSFSTFTLLQTLHDIVRKIEKKRICCNRNFFKWKWTQKIFKC